MALVPYRVSGAAADQRSEWRVFQLPGGVTLRLRQRPADSGARRTTPLSLHHQPPPNHATNNDRDNSSEPATPHPTNTASVISSLTPSAAATTPTATPPHSELPPPPPPPPAPPPAPPGPDHLANVGLVVWQSGFVLAEYLLRTCPFGPGDPGSWLPLTAVDLGTGTGLVGIALALAGVGRVVLTDLPHVVPLAEENVGANCELGRHRAEVRVYRWGDPVGARPSAGEGGGGGGSGSGVEGGEVRGCGGEGAGEDSRGVSSMAPGEGRGVQGQGEQQQQQQEQCPLQLREHPQPDLITAADCLYHPDLHAPLLRALELLSMPHTVSYVSYRLRTVAGDEAARFAALADAAGFAVERVPPSELHEEYGNGGALDSTGAGSGARAGAVAGARGGDGLLVDGGADSDEEGGTGVLGRAAGAVEAEFGPFAEFVGRVGEYGILRLCRRDAGVQ